MKILRKIRLGIEAESPQGQFLLARGLAAKSLFSLLSETRPTCINAVEGAY